MANRRGHDGDDALFVKDGAPVKFCFHRSVTQGRGQITRNVERHGGEIVADERLTNVLLVDEQEDIAFIRRRYYSSTELYRLSLYVEPRGFVQACIRAGTYRHEEPVAQGMPGRARGGRTRVEFTEEDRDRLAYYLATRCPTRDGRMGVNAYRDLERLGQSDDPSWEWARRHTTHSWREHYKMNPGMMDGRINYYLERLKDVGHHLGHDPRRHDFRNLRQELREEEEEEGEDEEENEPEREPVRPDRGRRGQPHSAGAERRPEEVGRNYLARHERDLVAFDGEEADQDEEVVIQELQRAKRRRVHPDAHLQSDTREAQAKRTRVAEASANERRASGVEAGRADAGLAHEAGTRQEGSQSQELEGSDLFGDREYEDERRFDFDDQEVHFPEPLPLRTSPTPEQDGPPPSTQATLIASPRSPEKAPSPVPGPSPTRAAEAPRQPIGPPPSSQRTLVMTPGGVVVRRARVRGPSVEPGPSVARETRTRGGAAATAAAPYPNTRARSRSVEPRPQPESESAPQSTGKGKAKQDVLVPTEEIHVEEPQGVESARPTSTAVGETFEDEMVVEELLEASMGDEVDMDRESEGEHADAEIISDGDEDEDENKGILDGLAPYEVFDVEDKPVDSDDAETHAMLVQDAFGEGGDVSDGGQPSSGSDEDVDQLKSVADADADDADDADRIERMASGGFHAAPVPTPPQPRITRSKAATQSQVRAETRAETQYHDISPRRTRSTTQARGAARPNVFPSPGTKARVAVDRFQEEKKRVPYAPPLGTRAANAVKGKGKRG